MIRITVETFGQPAANHNWGFDQQTRAAGSRITRSQTTPAVASMTAPYDEAWVTAYNQTAQEPNSTNITYNYDNSSYARKQDTYVEPYTTWYAEFQTLYPEANYGWNWNQAVAAAKADGSYTIPTPTMSSTSKSPEHGMAASPWPALKA